jgi:hypothetical protein
MAIVIRGLRCTTMLVAIIFLAGLARVKQYRNPTFAPAFWQ